MQTVEIADAAAFERTLRRLAHQILENNPEPEQVLLVGILRRGVPLAEELAGLMERFGGVRPPVETLDITLYRDDLSELGDLRRCGRRSSLRRSPERPSSLWTTSSTPAARRAPRWRPSSASAARHASGWP